VKEQHTDTYNGFTFSLDTEVSPYGRGLVVEIPGFGPWWLDPAWLSDKVELDGLPAHEDFCDEDFAERLNAAIDDYIAATQAGSL
jgi:hypothetical protein|tara:strand:- start:88 stop:342 length:255 start_codon:yes stop_codon:yes gene_type:complete